MEYILFFYVLGFVLTSCYDSAILFHDGVELLWAIVFGLFNGIIWPIRWGYDIVAWFVNKGSNNHGIRF